MTDLNIHTIELPMPGMFGTVNCYLIESDGRAALIDTGMSDECSIELLEKKLAHFNVSVCALEKVICTHFHPDHCGLGKRLQDEGVPVMMSAPDADALKRYFESPSSDARRAVFYGEHDVPRGVDEHVMPAFDYWRTLHQEFVPNELLEEGQQLILAGHLFEILITPGHTDGHLCLLQRQTKTLFLGDHMLKDSAVHIALRQESQANVPLMVYLEALERIASLGPLRGFPGHGGRIENTQQRCEELIQLYQKRISRVKEVLTATPQGAIEISELAFGVKRRPFSKWLCMAQAIACLEYLKAFDQIGAGNRGNKQEFWDV